MSKRPGLNPLRAIKTPKDIETFQGSRDEKEDQEQPLSPVSRLFHEPGTNIYNIAVLGAKTLINPEVCKADAVHEIIRKHRFSCLQVLNEESGGMKWVPIHVNIDDHVIVPELDPNMESSDTFVENYISNLSRSRIDPSKPLWDLHILNTKTSDAEATCIFRFHQSLGDGVALMNLLLDSSRKASDPEALATLSGHKTSGRNSRVTNFRSLVIMLWNSIVGLLMFFLSALFLKDTNTPLTGSPGVEDRPRRFVIRSVSFDDIKLVKNAMDMDVTVNDVVLGVIKAGLYRYLKRRYGAGAGYNNSNIVPKNMRLRATVLVNMRPTTRIDASTETTRHGAWGNKMGFVLLPFNIRHKEDLLDYVREVKTDMDRKKASLEPLCTSVIADLVIKFLGFKFAGKLNHTVYANTTLALSNVPGPQDEISLFGHEVKYLAASCYGQPMALMINVVSYVNKMTFVVSADEETIPDPHKLSDDLLQSLHLMKSSALATGCIKS